MESLIIEGGANSPSVNFNSETGEFKIFGRSIPEHPIEIFEPIENWVLDYLKNLPNKICLSIYLDYLNTHSTGRLLLLMRILESYYNKNRNTDISIIWNIEDEDEDMEDLGYEIKTLLDLPMELKKH